MEEEPIIKYYISKNFGDNLNKFLFENFIKKPIKTCSCTNKYECQNSQTVIMGIGSILHRVDSTDIVYGSGLKHDEPVSIPTPKKILSVRGPLTRSKLIDKEIDCPETYGDPALLLPFIIKPPTVPKRFKLGFIPHTIDQQSSVAKKILENNDVLFIDILEYESEEKFVEQICSCELILSSSLHGIIIADAYNVPAYHIKINDVGGYLFKFKDYFASVNRPYYTINFNDDVHKMIEQMIPYKCSIDIRKMVEIFPCIDESVREDCLIKLDNNFMDYFSDHSNNRYSRSNKAIIITCNETYVPHAIVALKYFVNTNPDYDMFIIGTVFGEKYYEMATKHNITLKTIDLSKDFINFDKRPYGLQYPIEMFYHLYAYKILSEYDYLVKIEPDIYTNKPLDLNLEDIEYLAAVSSNDFTMKKRFGSDLHHIFEFYGKYNENLECIRGGTVIYNTKNLFKINFYETILKYYVDSWSYDKVRCGDDTLMCLYQLINEDKVKLLHMNYGYIANRYPKSPGNIRLYHSFRYKWWNFRFTQKDFVVDYLNKKIQDYVANNFDKEFISTYFPIVSDIILGSN